MMKFKSLLLIPGLAFFMMHCTTVEEPQTKVSKTSQVLVYQVLLNMEYAMLQEDYESVAEYSKSLEQILKGGYKLYCPSESTQIDGARMTNHLLASHLAKKNKNQLLDDLRILKGTIIYLSSDEDYDPYYGFLWRFEEDMFAATEIAADPMLDLYEWNEFQVFVACMNNSWQPLKMHYPSPELLNYDTEKYKAQTMKKIYLEKAVTQFNEIVDHADDDIYPLCDAAQDLREAYKSYIYTLIQSHNGTDHFMATL